jgi:hypothetical protein
MQRFEHEPVATQGHDNIGMGHRMITVAADQPLPAFPREVSRRGKESDPFNRCTGGRCRLGRLD